MCGHRDLSFMLDSPPREGMGPALCLSTTEIPDMQQEGICLCWTLGCSWGQVPPTPAVGGVVGMWRRLWGEEGAEREGYRDKTALNWGEQRRRAGKKEGGEEMRAG